MAIYLDEQLEDEPLFGIVARYLESGPAHAVKPTIRRLFGQRMEAFHMGGGLDYVARETEPVWGFSPVQIAEKMTSFPYCEAIFSPERSHRILNRMCGLLPAGRISQCHIGTWNNAKHGLRYCRGCLHDDKVTDGIAHWRRSHQLPGVVVCPWHGEVLWEYGGGPGSGRLEYISPSTAIQRGTSRIDLSLTRHQGKCCQTFAQVSAELLGRKLSIDTCSFAQRFRDFMGQASPYLAGPTRGQCLGRLMSQCFGEEYLEMHGVLRRRLTFFVALSMQARQHLIRNVMALSLIRLVEEQPTLVSRQRFGELCGALCQPETRRALPEITCPSRYARHGRDFVVTKVGRYRGKLRAVCDCGMCFMCAETADGVTLLRIIRWAADYDREVRRLRRLGWNTTAISRLTGVPPSTVSSMQSTNGRFLARVLPITPRKAAKHRSCQ